MELLGKNKADTKFQSIIAAIHMGIPGKNKHLWIVSVIMVYNDESI